MNKHDNKVWNDYRDKVEWYFSQEWSDRPYYEVLYGELKKPIDDELSEKNILIHERAESIIWEAWNAVAMCRVMPTSCGCSLRR